MNPAQQTAPQPTFVNVGPQPQGVDLETLLAQPSVKASIEKAVKEQVEKSNVPSLKEAASDMKKSLAHNRIFLVAAGIVVGVLLVLGTQYVLERMDAAQ